MNKENTSLFGHFARPNSQWKDIKNQIALAIFHGPHCYISPSWYETYKAVPTWNYVTVHVYGDVELLEDENEYRLEDVDAEFLAGMNKGVQGFHSALIDMKAKKGFFVTTGEFTKTAIEYSNDKNIELINGNSLLSLLQKATSNSNIGVSNVDRNVNTKTEKGLL